jgi:alkylation response protein AidB-like acyl-CoA dehydrogenase
MQFTFDEEQRLAAQSLRDVLDDLCTGADLRRAAEAREAEAFAAACRARRERLQGLGFDAALVAEAQGGLGLGPVDLVLLAEEAGRAALPEPLIESAGIALPLLAALAARDPRAEAMLQESMAGGGVAIRWSDRHLITDVDTTRYVIGGASDSSLALYSIEQFTIERHVSVDPLRRLAKLDALSAEPLAIARDADVVAIWRQAERRSMVLEAAQLIGLAERMTSLAVAYSLERKQFGKAIGANQAVKHQLANVQIRIEFARPVVYAAAASLRKGLESDETADFHWSDARIAHAAIAARDAADLAARTAIQVHGAMGYSWELDLQFYAKRSWALAGLNGGRAASFSRLHDALMQSRIEIGPDQLFGNSLLEGF